MMIQCWPNLQMLYSINPKGQATFMDFMKEHGPNIEMQMDTRY